MSLTVTGSGADQTTGPVTWDYTWFQQRYPTIAEWVSPEEGQMFFDIATLFLSNNDSGGNPVFVLGMPFGFSGQAFRGSPVRDIRKRQMLLGLLTAHIATMFAPVGGEASSPLVGRITNATEGSVNVAVDFPTAAGQEWYAQTKYGAMFWAATTQYRLGRYHPGPQRFGQDGLAGGYSRRGNW